MTEQLRVAPVTLRWSPRRLPLVSHASVDRLSRIFFLRKKRNRNVTAITISWIDEKR